MKYYEIPGNIRSKTWNTRKYFDVLLTGSWSFYSFYWDTWNVKKEIQWISGNTKKFFAKNMKNQEILENSRKYLVKSYDTFLCISIFGNTYNFFLMFTARSWLRYGPSQKIKNKSSLIWLPFRGNVCIFTWVSVEKTHTDIVLKFTRNSV
jgi:hypothetical protein